ncbi:hypothetical protein HanXRQr2_Chr03g0126731 [Helianthus annuus]|uniref:Uncharacterized protein n=1 Tax=Helianthus annuus TaxID=4232 RepID=A0A9K3JIE8_HELAN|nr:hypothetical protein HanXRQr2_Chr03g0126731 [Helianthus annuus]KAJ0945022.1 hypothetical protein HanPSC8_Chr03g0123331 [Helianthus annuus]
MSKHAPKSIQLCNSKVNQIRKRTPSTPVPDSREPKPQIDRVPSGETICSKSDSVVSSVW